MNVSKLDNDSKLDTRWLQSAL